VRSHSLLGLVSPKKLFVAEGAPSSFQKLRSVHNLHWDSWVPRSYWQLKEAQNTFDNCWNCWIAPSSILLAIKPIMQSTPRTARGTSVSFRGISRPILTHLNVMEDTKISTRHDSYEKFVVNLKGRPCSWSCKDAKHPKPCEKHGCAGDSSRTNVKELTMKRNVSHQMTLDPESMNQNECACMQLFDRIENLQWSQQNTLQRINTRSHCRWNDSKDSSSSCCGPNSTSQEYSQKSKKARRHRISPDTSSLQRNINTGEIKSNINLNLNTKTNSKPVNSEGLIFF
jgi:hypothetical protein